MEKSFLGQGWNFPPTFNKRSKGAVMVAAEEDILQSLEILLSTALGERFLEPDYGCDLRDYLFETLDPSTQALIEDRIRMAILYNEPRIDVDQVVVSMEDLPMEGMLQISVDFKVRGTNSRYNRVFPFYLQEGTLLPSASLALTENIQ